MDLIKTGESISLEMNLSVELGSSKNYKINGNLSFSFQTSQILCGNFNIFMQPLPIPNIMYSFLDLFPTGKPYKKNRTRYTLLTTYVFIHKGYTKPLYKKCNLVVFASVLVAAAPFKSTFATLVICMYVFIYCQS